MVPVQTEEMKDGDPMRVCVEGYGFLPVDKAAFKGQIPAITGMVPFEPFDFYIKRKLYIHNMGHATCAYLGGFTGKEFIWQAIADPDVYIMVQNAMEASALALSKKYGVDVSDLFRHIQDLLVRFTNAALQDTCDRVGREPERKLDQHDRLVGSWALCREMGVDNSFQAAGIAGALLRYLTENNLEQNAENAAKALKELSGQEIPQAIRYYEMLLSGCTLTQLRKAVELDRHAGLVDIV
jgi:mannitol-1-phosphate 5-dehydrogenase